MGLEILATTAGVAVLMAVLPRALFALRQGRAEGLTGPAALILMSIGSLLAVLGAWLGHAPTFLANLAAVGSCAGFLVIQERCRDIQDERTAIAAKMKTVRPPRRARRT